MPMPRKADVHQSKYYRAGDYADDWTLTAEVETARLEDFENGHGKAEKLVVYFRKQKPGLVIGPTVWDQFADVTGSDESDDWKGAVVELYRDKTSFQGKMVPCIRVRKPGEKPKAAKKRKPDDTPDMDDEIRF
jgi:hypothetical protein